MAQSCTAILIDPFARLVTEVTWNGDYRHIYELIGADCYDCARINGKGDGVFVDDEGLFKEEQAFFWHEDYPQPLAGKGLILGCDDEGESVRPHTTIEEVRSKVSFGQPMRLNGADVWVAHA
jgi:hypothetical protein